MLLIDKHINANEDVRCIDPSFFCSSANMCLTKPGPTEPGGGGGGGGKGKCINAKVTGLRYCSMW